MKICLFGASGRTGQLIVRQAIDRGHHIIMATRRPFDTSAFGERAEHRVADLSDPEALRSAVSGAGLVMSALGTTDRKPNTVLSDGTRNIIEAMKAENVQRLIAMTSIGCRDSLSLLRSFVFRELIVKRLAKEIWADKNRQEEIIEQSDLDYLIVRPGGLSDKLAGKDYAVLDQFDRLPKKIMIARQAVAAFMLDAAEAAPLGERIVSVV